QDGRPHRPALGAPRLLQSQSLGARCLSRPAPQTPSVLSRRVCLPLQPPPHSARRLPLPSRHRRRPRTPQLQNVDLTGSKGISLIINVPSPSDFQSFYVFAVHKSGSSLLNK